MTFRLKENGTLGDWKSIIDELSNHYGLWESPKFYEDDNIIKFKKK